MSHMFEERRQRLEASRNAESAADANRRQGCIDRLPELAVAVVAKIKEGGDKLAYGRDRELTLDYQDDSHVAWLIYSYPPFDLRQFPVRSLAGYEILLVDSGVLVSRLTTISGRVEVHSYDPDRYGESVLKVMSTYGNLVHLVNKESFQKEWMSFLLTPKP